ncbi:hypothetical protein PAEPH01_2090 [Pancytospora epiphaga]|nr:hypothetical protein PAEPH01_2090 [Pancytospora epiphaga]
MTEAGAPRKMVFNDDAEAEADNRTEKEVPSEVEHRWESFNLKPDLVKGIYAAGFEIPSYIQKKAIPVIIEKKDLRAQAQSGTGKTGAFVVGALQRIDVDLQAPQCLVLAPTREIAKQNATKFQEIGAYMGVSACLLAGGTSVGSDIRTLSKNPHVVVGTPGRIGHMLNEGHLSTKNIHMFILDEADEMLKAEFETEVYKIYDTLNKDGLQTLLFSATYEYKDLQIIKDIVEDPVEIDLRNEDQTLQGIKQLYVNIGSFETTGYSPIARDNELMLKVHTFIDIFKNQTLSQVLIFINRKADAALVHKTLNSNGYPCDLITSDLDQEGRNKTLEDFKLGKKRILVSSGLCKRGIDVQSLSLVVCLDVPRMVDRNDYIHRVGRSGRYGRKGIALHILTKQEIDQLQQIGAHFNSIITPLQVGFDFKQ